MCLCSPRVPKVKAASRRTQTTRGTCLDPVRVYKFDSVYKLDSVYTCTVFYSVYTCTGFDSLFTCTCFDSGTHVQDLTLCAIGRYSFCVCD